MKKFRFNGHTYVWNVSEFKENVLYPILTGFVVTAIGLVVLAYACDHPEQFFTSNYWGM